ncbi:MAG: hypothetical protein WDZ52_14900 [Pseudohongiellaceae bacterium]
MVKKSSLLEEMINTPSKYFENPGQVLSYPGLEPSERADILRSWKQDVILLMKAAEENMANGNNYDLEGINKALNRVAPEQEQD